MKFNEMLGGSKGSFGKVKTDKPKIGMMDKPQIKQAKEIIAIHRSNPNSVDNARLERAKATLNKFGIKY